MSEQVLRGGILIRITPTRRVRKYLSRFCSTVGAFNLVEGTKFYAAGYFLSNTLIKR